MNTTEIMPYEITVQKVKNSRLPSVDLENIAFGRIFTDHMLMSDFVDNEWQDTSILPFGKLELSPATTALHYGQEIFEGLKAYKNDSGEVFLFRPQQNFKRMNLSAERMCMPAIPSEIFLDGMYKLIDMERDWIPATKHGALYIRPFMFASDEYVGIKIADNYKFIIFCSPVNAYYAEPIKVKIEQYYVRASEGGTGEAKTAGNYSASLYAVSKALKQGYRQMLWTDSTEHKWIEESGTMNVFFVIDDKVITPALDGCILHGVTRDSCLTLLRDKGVKVEERRISVDEVVDAYDSGRLKDVFGAGTAATIAQIEAIGYNDRELTLPNPQEREISNWLLDTLENIKRGHLPDKYNWLVKI